jgi:2,4-dienoyl-CoA reductase-like NADH-dependent reductase (Old Yellow Enzyme family)
MSPMTRAFSPDGVPGEDVAAYYARRAESLGIVMTEGSYVNESAGGFDNVPRLFGDDALAAWRKVTDGVHAVGGFIFSQLWHIGAQREPGAGPYPDSPMISPSGINCDGQVVGEPATIAQLEETVEDFARAAVFAKAAGFDGLDLHGAHGYLLDQFHWPVTNRRTDAYGGDMAGRVRLSAEIAAAVRAAVGPEFPVDFRFSQWKGNDFDARIAESPKELEAFLTPLVEAGVSMFHASTRRYWQPAFDGSGHTLAGWTRHLSGRPVIGIGSVGVGAPFMSITDDASSGRAPSLSLAPLADLVNRGEFDLVAMGRACLADPHWAVKVSSGRLSEIRPYNKSADAFLY